MEIERFVDTLPGKYDRWGTLEVRPRRECFAEVLSRVRGMATPSVLQLLNHAVDCLAVGESYAEVGCFQGSTVIGALVGHPGVSAIACDNFTEFDPGGENRHILRRNLAAFGMTAQVRFSDRDFTEYLPSLWPTGTKVGVYLYDGAHDYRSQLLGLLLAEPLLADAALVVVDDANFPAVRQATWDFLAARPQARVLLELPTPRNGHGSFWNGLLVLRWERSQREGTDRGWLHQRREQELLRSLHTLQQVAVRIEGEQLIVTSLDERRGGGQRESR